MSLKEFREAVGVDAHRWPRWADVVREVYEALDLKEAVETTPVTPFPDPEVLAEKRAERKAG